MTNFHDRVDMFIGEERKIKWIALT